MLLTKLLVAALQELEILFFCRNGFEQQTFGSPPIPHDNNQMLFIFTKYPSHFECLLYSKCNSKTVNY